MPKERTHWILADKILDSPGCPELKKIISSNRNLYYVGAVAPDIPLYYLWGREKERIRKAFEKTHGKNGGNTLSFLAEFVRNYGNALPPSSWAFLSGIVCHVMADSQFHPMVIYFCGTSQNANEAERRISSARHNTFETYLDLHYSSKKDLLNEGLLINSLKNIEIPESLLLDIVRFYLVGMEEFPEDVIRRAIYLHAKIQEAFSSSLAGKIITFLDLIPVLDLKDFRALFYPDREITSVPFFQKPISYRHPVTGEYRNERVEDIESRVKEEALKIFRVIEEFLTGRQTRAIGPLESLVGPRLDTGLPRKSNHAMKYFDIHDIKKMLFAS